MMRGPVEHKTMETNLKLTVCCVFIQLVCA